MTDTNTQTKQALVQGLSSLSSQLIQYLGRLNLDPKLKQFAFMNLDQSMFWAQQAIMAMEFDSPVNTTSSDTTATPDDIQLNTSEAA